jgi:hypothetical protein
VSSEKSPLGFLPPPGALLRFCISASICNTFVCYLNAIGIATGCQ